MDDISLGDDQGFDNFDLEPIDFEDEDDDGDLPTFMQGPTSPLQRRASPTKLRRQDSRNAYVVAIVAADVFFFSNCSLFFVLFCCILCGINTLTRQRIGR
jgi:hypothetical protein